MKLESPYLGLSLRSPLIASASPLTGELDNLRRLEDIGAAAVVLPSLFEEQLCGRFDDPSWSLHHGLEAYPAALSYLPREEDFARSPDEYLELVRDAAAALSIPVIASLSGAQSGDWTAFARRVEQAGADALELSIYHVPTEFEMDAALVEADYARMVAEVRRQIAIPLAVKLCPFFTSFPHFARRVVENGADGLVLFNRLFTAEINLEHAGRFPVIRWTSSRDLELPLRWISLLHCRLETSLAASSGVHTGRDALKAIFAGADVVMMCSALMIRGVDHLRTIEREMIAWLDAHGHPSVASVRGSMSLDPRMERSAFERANYVWAVGHLTPAVKREAGEV